MEGSTNTWPDPLKDACAMPNIFRYGPDEAQFGELYLPAGLPRATICLFHGGFWRMPYDLTQMSAVARDLSAAGYVVWNLEYRRIGAPGGGFPGSLEDAASGIDHLAVLAGQFGQVDLRRVVAVGHSAGGHLALWAAGRPNGLVSLAGAAGLAPLADLENADELGLGRNSVTEFLDADGGEKRRRLREASPRHRLPAGVRQLILHGDDDEAVPVDLSRRYAAAAEAAGDDVDYVELVGGDHMAFLDPASVAHAALKAWLDQLWPVTAPLP